MAAEHNAVPDREERLNAVLVACLEAIDHHQVPGREALLARYPEFAAELNQFLDDQERVHRCTTPLRALAATAGGKPSADTIANLSQVSQAGPPSCLGDYELLEEIGRGGTAVVYRARQKSLGRVVAVKVIHGADGLARRDADRFRQEAELAAQLDHPHIIPIYQVSAQDGFVYFSMKLAEGGSLADCLDRVSTDPSTVARLMATMARAVHHAHQRGVLHRDLKPANILLDLDGQPHVTDFGLGRRVEGDSSLTQLGAVVGTPSYMAPEQTTGQKGVITTAADVYGLGAVFYALLTGKPPFRGDTAVDTLLLVREQEPEPPRRSRPRIDRDLETICLKCLRKEPPRRYESTLALAEDLERWLNGVPIQARPGGSWERSWKWVRRRPAVASLVAVVACAAAGLVAGLLWHNSQLQQAAAREKAAADRERHERQLARQAVDSMYTQVATKWLADEPQLTDLQRSFLEEALRLYQALSEGDSNEPAARHSIAGAHRNLGEILTKLERRAEAEREYNQAVAGFTELLAEDPNDPDMAYDLAMAYRGLGALMHQASRLHEAEKAWRRGLETAEKLVHERPNQPEYQHVLGTLCINLGSPLFAAPEAEKSLRRAQMIYEKLLARSRSNAEFHETLGNVFNNLAIWRMEQKKPAEARQLLQQAIKQNRAALQINPRLKSALLGLRGNYSILGGDVLRALGKHQEALKAARAGLGIAQKLTAEFPAVPFYERDVADSQGDVGRALMDLGRLKEAEEAFRQARRWWEKDVARSPGVRTFRSLLAETCDSLGGVLQASAKDREAIAEYRRALEVAPRKRAYKVNLAWALVVQGTPTERDAAEAATLARQATDEYPRIWQAWNALGGALYRLGKWGQSVQALEKAMELNKSGCPPATHLLWAMAQWRLGQKAKARERYRQVSEAMGRNIEVEAESARLQVEAAALLGLKAKLPTGKKKGP